MYKYLFDIALILVGTKFLGMVAKKIQLPSVVGALCAGLLLGPLCFNIVGESDLIKTLSEIGVIVLMYAAGLETDVRELKKSGFASLIIALMGVVIPLIGGLLVAKMFNKGNDHMAMLQNIFIGVVLTATSVSITVETLKELGKLSTHSGNAILGAALIDDVLGIVALTIITSFADSSVNLVIVLVKIIAFFLASGVIAFLFIKFIRPWMNKYEGDWRVLTISGLAFCFIMSYAAEELFGVSDITGAFIAGLILSDTKKTTYMQGKYDTVSYMLLSPIFFANVGLQVSIDHFDMTVLWFSLLLLVVAILSKVLGCGLGARMMKYTNLQATKIGIGMISRGEVALIVATKGMSLGLLPNEFFAPIIIVVVATTIITPILLKMVYRYQARITAVPEPMIVSELVERQGERMEIEYFTQQAVKMHEDMKEQMHESAEKKTKK